MFDRLLLALVGTFLLLYGIMHATNLQIVWMEPICAICALFAGAVCCVRAVRNA